MEIEDGIMMFDTTPFFLREAELLHLHDVFNRKKTFNTGEDKAIKLLPEQEFGAFYKQNFIATSQKDSLKFTQNGIYLVRKLATTNLVQIDLHSSLPTMAYALGLFDAEYKKLFERKREIERTSDYQSNAKLVQERKDIKFKLNLKCSTNDSGQGRYVNRLRAMYSLTNLVFDMLNWWGLSHIVNVVNDGFIMTIPSNFDERYLGFTLHYQSMINELSFSMKKWQYGIIKNAQEYILINNVDDYKCRNHQFDLNSLYRRKTGKSLRTLKSAEVNQNVLAQCTKKERTAVKLIYNYLFKDDAEGLSAVEEQDSLEEAKNILHEAGLNDVQHQVAKQYFATLELVDPDDSYLDQFTRRLLLNQVFVTNQPIKDRVNLLGQRIEVTPIEDIDSYLEQDHIQVVTNYLPSIVDSKDKDQSLQEWLEYEVKKIQSSDGSYHYQYNILAMVAQLWAHENKMDPNVALKLLHDIMKTQYLKKLDLADIIYNDPRTLVVDGQLMVKDENNVYTIRPAVVNNLIKKYLSSKEKQHFDLVKNNLIALLQDEKYQDQLDVGFTSTNQTVWLDDHGLIYTGSPFKRKIGHHVNVPYNPAIVDSEEYYLVNRFLKHLAPNQTSQLKAMLGLIVLQYVYPDIMKELRRFFLLYGVPNSGKTVLSKLLEGIFNFTDRAWSSIVGNTQNVNKALTDPHIVALNDTKLGKMVLWFDDFQSSSRSNVISTNAATVINGIISGVAQIAGAKYEKDHAVKLPSLIIIATNSLPQVSQQGTASRMFVINSPKSLKEDPLRDRHNQPVNMNDFINNPKVLEALFYIIIQEASKMLKMTPKERAKVFDQKHSAATKLTFLNDSFEWFLEDEGITSLYDLVGIQANSLLNMYKDKMKVSISRRSFYDQLKSLGYQLKRKNFNGHNYNNVICAPNNKLTQEKLNAMLHELNLAPNDMNKYKQGWDTSITAWHYDYDEMKKKYTQNTDLFTPFDFTD